MSVNLIIAAGLFDSPWTVVVFVLAGAIINWLTKRRADSATAKTQAPDSAAPASKPPVALPWEERLRQMLEQDPPPPQPTAASPQVPPSSGVLRCRVRSHRPSRLRQNVLPSRCGVRRPWR